MEEKQPIIVSIDTDKSTRKKFEKSFMIMKLSNMSLKKKEVFLAFVEKFAKDPKETAEFINLKK